MMSNAGLTCNPLRFSCCMVCVTCPSLECSQAQSSIFKERLREKMRFLPTTNRKHRTIPLRRGLIMKNGRIKSEIFASFGDMADNSSGVFPRIQIKDPYQRLGISKEASEEEIQAARNFLINKYAGHQPSVDAIESAHDKIIMRSFYDRKSPKINIKKKVREVTQSRYVKAITSRFQTPSTSIILKTSIAFIVLGVLTILFPTEEGPTLQVAISLILSIYFIYERLRSRMKACLYGSLPMNLGLLWSVVELSVSAGKTKYVMDHVFHLDIIFCLMESFLIAREVLVIGHVKQHPSSFPAFPDYKFHLDVGNNCVLSDSVTVSQFIAGCTILASICVAADDIGILLAFSYKLLQTCNDNITWVLLALHVFANIFGKGFFNLDNYGFLVTTINSVVLLLEDRLKSVSCSSPCYLNSTSKMAVVFSPCKKCPFAADAICMDKLLNFLLDVLEDYSLTGNDNPNISNYFISLSGSAPTRDTKDKGSSDAKSKFDVHCDASCGIFKYSELTGNQPDSRRKTVFCDFTDIISLVELVAHYMGWEWMNNEAVPRLLKMLEICVCEEFSAALFVLVGELGRRGISSVGYQQAGIAELRSNLTKLLDTLIAKKSSLPTQVAAVGAILNLLSLKFEDILYEHRDIIPDSCESPCIIYIQKWFFKLSGKQQGALKNIFDDENHLRR